MSTTQRDSRLEGIKRALAVAGAAIGAAWGVQSIARARDPFGEEGRLQLTFALAVTMWFVALAANKQAARWFWANAAFLSVVWAVRSAQRDDSLGVAAFVCSAGLAIGGFIVASFQRAAQHRVPADGAAPPR
jgi:hypothetical protein